MPHLSLRLLQQSQSVRMFSISLSEAWVPENQNGPSLRERGRSSHFIGHGGECCCGSRENCDPQSKIRNRKEYGPCKYSSTNKKSDGGRQTPIWQWSPLDETGYSPLAKAVYWAADSGLTLRGDARLLLSSMLSRREARTSHYITDRTLPWACEAAFRPTILMLWKGYTLKF